ncbi:nicotinamide-nucleotide adenylyltransferase [Patescibacteria group bacterium]|nr:nicotinamide-nucleotide adenylyltransferase [Patescibacteria group bacterium]
MKSGLYTGRFQPFHLGHLSAVKQALNDVDFLYIGIGSAQYSHKEYNPFTADERKEMIEKALEENQIPKDRYKIIPIPDIHDNTAWPGHVEALVPEFDIVFVGDDGLVKELFEKHTGIPVKIVNRELDISATKIREAIVNNEDWGKYLSHSTAEYLGGIGGVERVKMSEL